MEPPNRRTRIRLQQLPPAQQRQQARRCAFARSPLPRRLQPQQQLQPGAAGLDHEGLLGIQQGQAVAHLRQGDHAWHVGPHDTAQHGKPHDRRMQVAGRPIRRRPQS